MKPFLLVSTRPEEEALDSEYQAYAQATGLNRDQLELADFDLVGLPPIDPEEYSGVFIAGSPYGGSAYGTYVPQRLVWVRQQLSELLEQLLGAGTPILVTGSAMKMLVEVTGGTMSAECGEIAEVTEIELSPDALQDPLTSDFPPTFSAYSSHSEAVDKIPEGAVRLARSLNTKVEMLRVGDNVYAVQFNPELDGGAIRDQISRYADAGDSGIGDLEALISIGRHSSKNHDAGRILKKFVEHFATQS